MPPSLAVYFTPRMLALCLLGFSCGLPFPLLFATLSFRLAEEGVDKASIGLFALVGTPFVVKFLWAPLADHWRLPLLTDMLGKRRSWIVAAQAGLALCLVLLGSLDPKTQLGTMAALALLAAFCAATQDIAVDACRIESLKAEEQGAGAAAYVFGWRIGALVSGAGSLFLAASFGWAASYAMTAALLGLGTAAALFSKKREDGASDAACKEEYKKWLKTAAQEFMIRSRFHALVQAAADSPPICELTSRPGWLAVASFIVRFKLGGTIGLSMLRALVRAAAGSPPIREFISRPGWLAVAAFIVCFKLGDAIGLSMLSPFAVELGFTKEEYATVVKLYGAAAVLAGSMIGGSLVCRYGVVNGLWVTGLLQMASTLAFVWQYYMGHDVVVLAVSVSLENLAGGMGGAAFVAYLSSLCHARFTATQYALFASLAASGRTWLAAPSGWLAEALGWPGFFVFSALAALPGLLMLYLIVGRGKGAVRYTASTDSTSGT